MSKILILWTEFWVYPSRMSSELFEPIFLVKPRDFLIISFPHNHVPILNFYSFLHSSIGPVELKFVIFSIKCILRAIQPKLLVFNFKSLALLAILPFRLVPSVLDSDHWSISLWCLSGLVRLSYGCYHFLNRLFFFENFCTYILFVSFMGIVFVSLHVFVFWIVIKHLLWSLLGIMIIQLFLSLILALLLPHPLFIFPQCLLNDPLLLLLLLQELLMLFLSMLHDIFHGFFVLFSLFLFIQFFRLSICFDVAIFCVILNLSEQ